MFSRFLLAHGLLDIRASSIVGVVVDFADHAPPDTKIRDVTRVLDLRPGLTPKLIELGQWIAGYYLAPVGEVFRGMLPPMTELTSRREIVLTELSPK